MKKTVKQLMEKFEPEAVEGVRGRDTRKHYDATYIKKQYLINRFNETLGLIWDWDFEITEVEKKGGQWLTIGKGRITLNLSSVPGEESSLIYRSGYGSCLNVGKGDAIKGAETDCFKRVASYFSCGWRTYAGILDENYNMVYDRKTKRSTAKKKTESSNGQAKVKQLKTQPAKKEKKQKSREDLQRYNTLKSLYFKGDEAKQAEKAWKKAVKENSKSKEEALGTCLVFLQTAKQKKKTPDQVVEEVVEMTEKLEAK